MESDRAVLVEMRAPASSANFLLDLRRLLPVPTFEADLGYRPVPLPATNYRQQMSLDTRREQLVVIRGVINDSRIEELSTLPGVVGIYVDCRIAPFNQSPDLNHHWPRRVCLELEKRGPDSCPIPPCDCSPEIPHGSIADVARYLEVDRIWQDNVKGDGIAVGVVDGGIIADARAEPGAFAAIPQVIGGWPIANWGTIAHWQRHGNSMASSILGMAPHARLYDIRISDGSTLSDAIAGFDWAINHFVRHGAPRILVNGWGIYESNWDLRYADDAEHPLTRKVVEAIDHGIIVVFAAGNCGQSCPASQCGECVGPNKSIWGVNGHERVLTVGAANIDEQLIGYSSQGPASLCEYKPDFCGIGHFAGYSAVDSGTSTASAVVAGVVALLLQAKPHLSSEALRKLLRSTAKDIGPPGWDRHSGAGIIQAGKAYEQLMSRCAKRPSGRNFDSVLHENRRLRELIVRFALEKELLADDGTLRS